MNTKRSCPDEQECLAIMKGQGMLPNIVDHSVQVMRVCRAIIACLRDPASVNIPLIIASALLHDIAKTRTIQTGEDRHDLLGGGMLRDMGLHDIAEIVECHVVFPDFNEAGPLEEREIVYYADKRVMHDEIVTIDERVADLVERYGSDERIRKMILANREFIMRLEAKIQAAMTCPIDDALGGPGPCNA